MAEEVCNIGPRERRKRRLMGYVSLAVTVGVAFILLTLGAPRWSRAIIFLPAWLAGLGLLQARERTCIALAARGLINMDEGEVKIDDPRLAASLSATARRVHRRALMTAIAVTLVTLAFPEVGRDG